MENALKAPFNPLGQVASDEDYRCVILRTQVAEIVGSYHHAFDVFLEAVQNAVDACEDRYILESEGDYSPQIKIEIDLESNTLRILDNGIGMTLDDITQYFFTPFATRKGNRKDPSASRLRGEKGVGTTFLAYSTNSFRVTTQDALGSVISARLDGARAWVKNEVAVLDMPKVEPADPLPRPGQGTTVEIKIDELSPLGLLQDHGTKPTQWEAILRLYTAIGYIDFDETDPFLSQLRVDLQIVNGSSVQGEKLIATGFLYPHRLTDSAVRKSQLSRNKRGELSVRQRNQDVLYEFFSAPQVADKMTARLAKPYTREALKHQIRQVLKDYSPQAYVAYVHSAEFWTDRNQRLWGENSEGLLTHGVVYATKRQRVGENERITLTSRTGDFNRFFVVILLDNIKPDIGRKSLPEAVSILADLFTNTVRSEFFDDRDALRPSPHNFDEGEEATLEAIRDKAAARELLPAAQELNLHLTRIPESEQDVIALFFDLLGLGAIRGYEVYATHTAQKYDGVGRFRIARDEHNIYSPANRLGIAEHKFRQNQVVSPTKSFFEFKQTTDGFVRDYGSGDKRLQDVKWLVCWDIGSDHEEAGLAIIEILDPAQVNQRDYFGVTHIMTAGQDKVHIICLKTLLETLQAEMSANA